MKTLIFQTIVEEISLDNLPLPWRDFDLKNFSKNKTLWDFQQKAIENAIKGLYLYYQQKFDFEESESLDVNNQRKEHLFELYQLNGLNVSLDYNLKKERKINKLLSEYYPQEDGKIRFSHFVNRASFWMATGSGKTLIIVKLLEILKKLIERKEIPQNDILILTCRDDLLEQLKEHIREFSSYQREIVVNLRSLKEYENVKREQQSIFKEKELTVFYYRSDLISDEEKEKLIDFKNYDNQGKWFILLDEAHKGDKEESKRQAIYSILSRNGFLFNFSATFTDPRDYVSCIFNFNLEKFINQGYGKHIYLSKEEIKAFKEKDDFSQIEKQKIVLKTLILLTYLQKFFKEIRKVRKDIYHKPLLLTLVNSVNVEEADLELFFKEIEKIGKGKISNDLFEKSKREVLEEFEENKIFEFEELEFEIDKKIFNEISYQDLLKEVYNSENPGNIEVLVIPKNRQELIFKLKTSDIPFASIKIGDVTGWIKEKLEGYEINESFDNESVFERIKRDDSEINILMGSRSFYEGWDSNRPNIILFINIGVGKDAKKFVLQSIGRGVRIEPLKNKRKRLNVLFLQKEIEESLFKKIKNKVLPLETLFVFGTNRSALSEIIATLKEVKEKEGEFSVPGIKINDEVKKYPLFVPVYKLSEFTFVQNEDRQEFPINERDFDLVKKYFYYLEDPKVFLMYHECDLATYKVLKESFDNPSEYYKFDNNLCVLNPVFLIEKILTHFSLRPEEFERFEVLDGKKFIVHFKKIKFLGKEKLEEFLEKVKKVGNYKEREDKLKQLELEFQKHKNVKRLTKEIQKLDKEFPQEVSFKDLKIKYIHNHYYIPLILSEKEKVDYIKHIIKRESEVKFVEKLEEYLEKENNLFEKFDWWFFSKIDEDLDEVYIPWYDPKSHSIRKFKPDFIFWLCKGKNYHIVFVDPKSISFTDYEYKVDWYKKLFENKKFDSPEKNYKIKVSLYLYTKEKVPQGYKKYWFENIEKVLRNCLTM